MVVFKLPILAFCTINLYFSRNPNRPKWTSQLVTLWVMSRTTLLKSLKPEWQTKHTKERRVSNPAFSRELKTGIKKNQNSKSSGGTRTNGMATYSIIERRTKNNWRWCINLLSESPSHSGSLKSRRCLSSAWWILKMRTKTNLLVKDYIR